MDSWQLPVFRCRLCLWARCFTGVGALLDEDELDSLSELDDDEEDEVEELLEGEGALTLPFPLGLCLLRWPSSLGFLFGFLLRFRHYFRFGCSA